MLLMQTAEISVMEDRHAFFLTRFSESASDEEQRDGRLEEGTISLFVRTLEESMLFCADMQ